MGECNVSRLHANKPILFIAGGTGFAPIKAMIEQLLAEGDARPIELCWGARSQGDLYMDNKALYWQSHVDHFHYFPLVSENNSMSLVDWVIARHAQALSEWQIVISGPFDMAYSIRDKLLAQGILPESIFSDAFTTV